MENTTENSSQAPSSIPSSLSLAATTLIYSTSIFTVFLFVSICLIKRPRCCCGVHLFRSRLPEAGNEEDGECSTVSRTTNENIFAISLSNDGDTDVSSRSPPTYASLILSDSICLESRWEVNLEEVDVRQSSAINTEDTLPSYDEAISARYAER